MNGNASLARLCFSLLLCLICRNRSLHRLCELILRIADFFWGGGGGEGENGEWMLLLLIQTSSFFPFFLWIDLTKGKVLKCAFAYDLSLAVLR